MERNNLKKGAYYCNMNGVYRFISNGFLGSAPVSAFFVCDYNEETGQYKETSTTVFMDEDEILTLANN